MELGSGFLDRSLRLFYQNRYICKLFSEKGSNHVYNVLNKYALGSIENAAKKALLEKSSPLFFLDINITQLNSGGVFCIENTKTQFIHIGQGANLISCISNQVKRLNQEKHINSELQKEWKNNLLKKSNRLVYQKDFVFSVLKWGLASKNERHAYEKTFKKYCQDPSFFR